jgi:hypothetical protein
MFPQPQPGDDDGFNERLLGAVPSRAGRTLEVGCARGRLGDQLNQLADRSRHIANMEASAFWRLRTVVHCLLRRR